ncbi:NAD(P)/FAD-dependent oxidoreductase [Microvirga zambiensis]|uniref:NAD(P)/FAD-dependent oxidoreductase n=1 Tax=Microvirga zambiensis TaxID=1402137 RepID=UPI00191F272E|nr:FAD-dependent oxidoreductase [Microvirga zambiensis]
MLQEAAREGYDCIIVGAGHGGAQAAASLRQFGFAGSIALIGAEPEMPYDRPALSKDYLAGKKTFDRMYLRPTDFWSARNIVLRRGRRVEVVDPSSKTITLDDSTNVSYGSLIWAAGGAPRALTCDGHNLSGIFYIRNKADCDALIAALPKAKSAVVIGGGFIGLEAAAILRGFGTEVTVVEALNRLLSRVAGEPVSRFYEQEHRRHGVEIRLSAGVQSIAGKNGRVSGVRLNTGETIAADLLIVGIGIIPSVLPLLIAGAEGGNGVNVDEFCRTSLADIYCVGDCACMTRGSGIRIESVQNASDQAITAARAICGELKPYDAVPWFWSNQYDLKLQTIGLNAGYDATILRGDPATRSFSLVYMKSGTVIALDCINMPRDYVQGRKLVETGARIDPTSLADTSLSLKDLVRQ